MAGMKRFAWSVWSIAVVTFTMIVIGLALVHMTRPAAGQWAGLNTYGGHKPSVDWWVAGDGQRVVEHFRALMQAGADKGVWNRPAGGDGFSHVAGSFYEAMNPAQQHALDTVIGPWLREHRDQFGVYVFIGSALTAHDSIRGWHHDDGDYPAGAITFNPDDPEGLAAWERVSSHIRRLGFKGVILDFGASSYNREWAVKLAELERSREDGLDIMIEAITLDRPDIRAKVGQWCLARFALREHAIQGPNRVETGVPLREYHVRPWERLIVRLDPHDVQTAIGEGWLPPDTTWEEVAIDFRRRGWEVQSHVEGIGLMQSVRPSMNGVAVENPYTRELVEVRLPPEITINDQERLGELALWIYVQGVQAGQSASPPTDEPSAPDPCAGKININAAGEAELRGLYGVGPAKAQAIVIYRGVHGPFESIEALRGVPGIGPATIQEIIARDQACVGHD